MRPPGAPISSAASANGEHFGESQLMIPPSPERVMMESQEGSNEWIQMHFGFPMKGKITGAITLDPTQTEFQHGIQKSEQRESRLLKKPSRFQRVMENVPFLGERAEKQTQDYFILNPGWGQRYALPAKKALQFLDGDLNPAQGNFRATISDRGYLTGFASAHDLPKGQVMRNDGENGGIDWMPVTHGDTIGGFIAVDEVVKSHVIMTDPPWQPPHALPAEDAIKLSGIDIQAMRGQRFNATFSNEGRLTGLAPARHFPPGKVMVENGEIGSDKWAQVKDGHAITGLIAMDDQLRDHFLLNAFPHGKRYALPFKKVKDSFHVDPASQNGAHFRVAISDEGELTEFFPATLLPKGQVMWEAGMRGSHNWMPVPQGKTVVGLIVADDKMESHCILDVRSTMERYVLPVHQVKSFSGLDPNALQGHLVRATISKISEQGHLSGFCSAHTFSPGQVMREEGVGSHIWMPVMERGTMVGSISVGDDSQSPASHVFLTQKSSQKNALETRYALPIKEAEERFGADLTSKAMEGHVFHATTSDDGRLAALGLFSITAGNRVMMLDPRKRADDWSPVTGKIRTVGPVFPSSVVARYMDGLPPQIKKTLLDDGDRSHVQLTLGAFADAKGQEAFDLQGKLHLTVFPRGSGKVKNSARSLSNFLVAIQNNAVHEIKTVKMSPDRLNFLKSLNNEDMSTWALLHERKLDGILGSLPHLGVDKAKTKLERDRKFLEAGKAPSRGIDR